MEWLMWWWLGWMLVTEMMGWMVLVWCYTLHSPTQGQDPGLIYEPPTGAVDGVNAHSRRVKALRYVMLPLQGIDNPEGVL